MATPRRSAAWAYSLVGVLALVQLGHVRADGPTPAGVGRWALPAVDQVLLPVSEPPAFSLAGTLGYGVTESPAQGVTYQRGTGDVFAGISPLAHLSLSLGLSAQYDARPAERSSVVSSPRATVLYARELAPGWQLGAAATWATAPAFAWGAPVVTGLVLAGWQATSALQLSAQAGFQLDRSGQAAGDFPELTRAELRMLGLSEWNSLPLGLAARTQLGALELAGELSAAFVVGAGSPSLWQSPLRAAAVGRWSFGSGLCAELLVRVGLSQRPDPLERAGVFPVEPRFLLGLGVRFAPARAEPPPKPSAPPRTRLSGVVSDADGVRVAAAQVNVTVDGRSYATETDAEGRFELAQLPRGAGVVSVTGSGINASEQPVSLDGSEVELALHVVRRAPGAQLRGLVRSFEGVPLPANVHVVRAARSVTADSAGRFVLELPPGVYRVEIECAGFLTQRRSVRVQKNGVTVLNVELRARER